MNPRYKIAVTIVLTTSLICVIKWLLPEPKLNTELRNEFWLRKTHTPEKFDIVAGGDSRIYRGFSIAAMTKVTNNRLTGINMGYSSAGFSKEYLDLLQERLTSTAQRFMVLGVSPHSFTMDAAKNELYHQYKNEDWFGVFKGLYLSGYLKHFAPYKADEIRDFLFFEPNGEGYFEEFRADGWVKSYKIPEDSLVAVDIYRKTFTEYQISDSLVMQFFLHLDTIREKGINVIAFRPPTFDMMSDLEDELSGYDENYIRQEMEKRGCYWIPLKNSDFHTYDGSHLHYESAEKLGRIVGECIQKIRAAD